ncbi:MAG: hypothetical protein AB7G15_19565 [Alphaproteobacteria bacterium]
MTKSFDTVPVTGAAGLIGLAVVCALIAQNRRVLVLGNLSTGRC